MKVIHSTLKYAFAAELGQEKVERGFAILAFSSVFLQKLGFSVWGGAIGLNAFILWGVLIWLYAVGVAVIVPSRLSLFAILLTFLMLSVLFGLELVSAPALFVLLFMYATLLFRVDVWHATLLSCFDRYQSAMWWIAWIIIGQQVIQYTVGNPYWPNLEKIIPNFLLIEGYYYMRPYSWNSPYFTPNGVFFLEPSAVSGFLATAVALELIWFRRLDRLALFIAATLLGMAGTGPTILAVCAPLLLFNLDRRMVGWTVGLGAPLLVVAFASGLLGHYFERSSEFYVNNSSGYDRFVAPYLATVDLASDPDYLLSGNGAGSSPKVKDKVQWPANKMIYEYGLLSAIVFHIFLLVAVLGSSVNYTMTLIVLIPHLFFGGGFVSHTDIMQLVMFGSLLKVGLGACPAGSGVSLPCSKPVRATAEPRPACRPRRPRGRAYTNIRVGHPVGADHLREPRTSKFSYIFYDFRRWLLARIRCRDLISRLSKGAHFLITGTIHKAMRLTKPFLARNSSLAFER